MKSIKSGFAVMVCLICGITLNAQTTAVNVNAVETKTGIQVTGLDGAGKTISVLNFTKNDKGGFTMAVAKSVYPYKTVKVNNGTTTIAYKSGTTVYAPLFGLHCHLWGSNDGHGNIDYHFDCDITYGNPRTTITFAN